MADSTYHYGLGRRKSSTARGRLYANGTGKVTINDKSLEDFTAGSKSLQFEFMKPLVLVHKEKEFDITIIVKGGGIHGQIDAARLSVSKALANLSDDYKSTLKKGGFLKRDPREKERKKYGLKGARKKEQFSKR